MDVITFKWSSIPGPTIKELKKMSNVSIGSIFWMYHSNTLIDWFKQNYDAKINLGKNFEMTVTMPRDKYTEFYLKWM